MIPLPYETLEEKLLSDFLADNFQDLSIKWINEFSKNEVVTIINNLDRGLRYNTLIKQKDKIKILDASFTNFHYLREFSRFLKNPLYYKIPKKILYLYGPEVHQKIIDSS